jgi:ParB-like chromosome segregation protein Spo0J
MLAHLSETQRRALVIADNKIAENAGWDEEMLRLELQALNDADFDLDITGFDFEDLERLLNGDTQENQGLTDDDAAPEITETPISQPGDLWLLGDHRVLCGSATVLADLETGIKAD